MNSKGIKCENYDAEVLARVTAVGNVKRTNRSRERLKKEDIAMLSKKK